MLRLRDEISSPSLVTASAPSPTRWCRSEWEAVCFQYAWQDGL